MVIAATLATPDFDTDSYIFFGTNNAFDPQITLGESLQGAPQYHFNFGIINFDVSSLITTGDKFLSLSAVEYITLTPNPGGPPTTSASPTGTATVHIVALGDSFANYQSAADKQAWYDTYVQNGSVSVVGTINFTDQGTEYLDVTDEVNAWINDGSSNYGFALFSTSGDIELASSTYADDVNLRPALVDTVPEPSGALLVGLGSLLLLSRRQRA